MKQSRLSESEAEAVAAQGLLFLSEETDRLERFMALSGLSVDELRKTAYDRGILTGILEYVLSDDSLVLGLAEFADIAPETPAIALYALQGHQEY